jgi:hypothetical protein
VGGFVIYMLLLAPLWLRTASWAAKVPPAGGGQARASKEALKRRLMSLTHPNLPFRVEEGPDSDEVVVTRDTLDDTWIGLLF